MRYRVMFGPDRVGSAFTRWGAERAARRYLRSKRNAMRGATRRHLRIERKR